MKKVILLFLGIMVLYACGYQEGIIQKGEKSFIKFSGNWKNISVQIDDMDRFVLKSGSDSEQSSGDDNNNKLFQISPGKHSIKVFRDGNLVVNRILLLDNQTTTEVIIP
jgi:hypothetical protein